MAALPAVGFRITPEAAREALTAQFREKVAAGELRPVLVPQFLIGSFVLPILYLAIPHVQRPWLYQARFLVFAVVVLLNLETALHSSSDNVGASYLTGLAMAWSTMWGFGVLICSRPQFEAERVERRPRPRPTSPVRHRSDSAASNGTAVSAMSSPPSSPAGSRYVSALAASNGHGYGNGHAAEGNGSANGNGHAANGNGSVPVVRQRRRKSVRFVVPPDEDVAKSLVEHEYYWQSFPADAPFLTRLDWAFDYYFAWRGSGWSRAIPSIPRFEHPRKALSGELVKIESIPLVTPAGYTRCTTNRQFLAVKLQAMALGYLALDFCSTILLPLINDPYWILGPDNIGQWLAPPPLPRGMAGALHPVLVEVYRYLYRHLLAFVGILAALEGLMSWEQLNHRLAARMLPGNFGGGVRGELWHYPSIFGSFDEVLEHGLSGFWGRYWHQSFRLGFTEPAAWLARQGYLPPPDTPGGKMALSFAAFFVSGCLHAGGSYMMLRPTKPWQPFLFFMLSGVGTAVQATTCALLRDRLARIPRQVRRAGNFIIAFIYTVSLCWLFIDDLSRSGFFLFEPPFSVLRALGFGKHGESPWRYDQFPAGWYVGRRWWERGIGFWNSD